MNRTSYIAYMIMPALMLLASPRMAGQEKIYLHTDRYRYIAGEDSWFSIYAIDTGTGTISGRSSVAYVELLNPWNKPVVQKRFHLSGGRGNGYFLLPDTSGTGIYTIRAYTNGMKGSLPYNCFIRNIEICNPFRGTFFNRKADSLAATGSSPYLNRKKISIDLIPGDTLARREKAKIRFGVPAYNAGNQEEWDLSIAVSRAGASPFPLNEAYTVATTDAGADKSKEIAGRGVFEKDGHFLSFRIKTKDGKQSALPEFLFMSVRGKVAEFRYARHDSSGLYTFILPVRSRSVNLILQPDMVSGNMILETEPSFPRIYPNSHTIREPMTDSLRDIFSDLSFNYQASKIYGMKFRTPPDLREEGSARKRRFYGIPEMEIRLDDYIKLPTMQEVFFELLPGIIFRTIRDGYEMRITNPLTGVFYDEPPLVMIDGVIINDLKVLADLDPELVERIEVVKTPYLTGDLILHGIVNVITTSGDFSDVTMPDYAMLLPYRVVEKPPLFTAPDYTSEQARQNRKPDLRNTLYWNPSIKTGRNGITEVEFFTSDLPGMYTINLFGISEGGSIVSQTRSFFVR